MFTDLLPARKRRLASASPFLINSSMTFSNILVPRNENRSEKKNRRLSGNSRICFHEKMVCICHFSEEKGLGLI